MGQQSVDEFVRYYLAPGMGHCHGSDGPDVFNMLKPIEDWVEKGIAPAAVIASKFNKQSQVVRTRPLCPFPQVARYDGKRPASPAACLSNGPNGLLSASHPAAPANRQTKASVLRNSSDHTLGPAIGP